MHKIIIIIFYTLVWCHSDVSGYREELFLQRVESSLHLHTQCFTLYRVMTSICGFLAFYTTIKITHSSCLYVSSHFIHLFFDLTHFLSAWLSVYKHHKGMWVFFFSFSCSRLSNPPLHYVLASDLKLHSLVLHHFIHVQTFLYSNNLLRRLRYLLFFFTS